MRCLGFRRVLLLPMLFMGLSPRNRTLLNSSITSSSSKECIATACLHAAARANCRCSLYYVRAHCILSFDELQISILTSFAKYCHRIGFHVGRDTCVPHDSPTIGD